ncbi:Conserved_hypothetical protein [Hexamita inflata]|uniref:Uncharacterized protein n=1 Tax=Hexamita inflata TaxID=28002 RepID=A0AA86NLL5_9EUKA|nr:Conserved hypothetical protein [Hexamita inflata]
MHLTFRLINSFEFSIVFYLVVDTTPEKKLSDVVQQIKEQVETNGKFRPVRSKIGQYDTFRVYCNAGQNKDMNLTFSDKSGVEIPINQDITIEQLKWQEGMEISFYNNLMCKQWNK